MFKNFLVIAARVVIGLTLAAAASLVTLVIGAAIGLPYVVAAGVASGAWFAGFVFALVY